MTQEEWKKNDSLMRASLKKMKLNFRRNLNTWEPEVYRPYKEVIPYDSDDNLIIGGVNGPESLGHVRYFLIRSLSCPSYDTYFIKNIFYGVGSYEELKIRLGMLG